MIKNDFIGTDTSRRITAGIQEMMDILTLYSGMTWSETRIQTEIVTILRQFVRIGGRIDLLIIN